MKLGRECAALYLGAGKGMGEECGVLCCLLSFLFLCVSMGEWKNVRMWEESVSERRVWVWEWWESERVREREKEKKRKKMDKKKREIEREKIKREEGEREKKERRERMCENVWKKDIEKRESRIKNRWIEREKKGEWERKWKERGEKREGERTEERRMYLCSLPRQNENIPNLPWFFSRNFHAWPNWELFFPLSLSMFFDSQTLLEHWRWRETVCCIMFSMKFCRSYPICIFLYDYVGQSYSTNGILSVFYKRWKMHFDAASSSKLEIAPNKWLDQLCHEILGIYVYW
jgi:hypothetical protein